MRVFPEKQEISDAWDRIGMHKRKHANIFFITHHQ